MKAIVSGGGTGGHIYPAIAIADQIRFVVPESDLLFIGAEGKMEMEKVPKMGYPIEGLPIRGFDRSALLKSAFTVPFKLLKSLLKARNIIKKFQPDVVVGVGGYASGPTLYAATQMGIPTVIQEQNSYAGVTNKLLAKRVNKICVAYEGMASFFGNKTVLTGNPVRKDIADVAIKKMEGLHYFGLKEGKKTILAFGGSLGARTINEAFKNSTALLEREDVQVLWQAGKLYINEFQECTTAQLSNVKIQEFIDRMDLAYAAADLIIGRAGALTISELCIVGKPSILVPSPNVAEDHQTKNAQALVEKDAAILVKDKEARSELLPTALALLENEERKVVLSRNIFQLAKPNATEEIVEVILNVIKQHKR